MQSAQRLLSAIDNLTYELFKAFVDEFSAWKNRVVKSYDDDYLIGAIYKENVFFRKEHEYTQLCKCHVALASQCLNQLMDWVNKNPTEITSLKNHILDYLFDLKRYVEQIMKKSEPTYVFIEGWKSDVEDSTMMFREARNLFWSSTVENANPMSHRNTVSLSAFALRQSLEVRFRRAIGVFKIVDQHTNDAKLRHDFILEFISENSNLIETKIGSMNNLSKIYKWTNFSIHTGNMPRLWEIQFAFDYCSRIFQPDPPDKAKGWHIHSSIKIKDYDELKRKFEAKVTAELTGNNRRSIHVAFVQLFRSLFQRREVNKWHFIYMNKPEAIISDTATKSN